jgi:hypothetical protein
MMNALKLCHDPSLKRVLYGRNLENVHGSRLYVRVSLCYTKPIGSLSSPSYDAPPP